MVAVGGLIRADQTVRSSFFAGVIDEVGVWSRALSAQEIADLYRTGQGNTFRLAPRTITGDVVRAGSGAPVAGASVALVDQWTGYTATAMTNAVGQYSVGAPPGAYTVTASANGYVSQTTTFTITVETTLSFTLTAKTPPGAPTSVSATALDGQAYVTWAAPAADGFSPILTYTVTSSPGGHVATTTGALSATVAGLTNGTVYSFTVAAANAIGAGPASTPSNVVTPGTGQAMLSGTITKAADATPVGGAVLTLVSQSSSFSATVTTVATGQYSAVLNAGSYTVTAQATGFAAETQAVTVTGNTRLDLALTPRLTVFADELNGATVDQSKWSKTDAENRLAVANGALSFAGRAIPTWGDPALVTQGTVTRVPGRSLEADVTLTSSGSLAIGWHDALTPALTSLSHALVFGPAGALSVREGTTETALAGTWSPGRYLVRVELLATGATYALQGGDYAPIGGASWSLVHQTSAGAAGDLRPALLVHSATGTLASLRAYASTAPDWRESVRSSLPRLDTGLDRLVNAEQPGALAVAASELGITLNGGRALVTVRVQSGQTATVSSAITTGDGLVLSSFGDYVDAWVRISQLRSLAQHPAVSRVGIAPKPRPQIDGEGSTLIGAPAWHSAGLTGTGVRIGIVDTGFQGYAALLGTELPATVNTTCSPEPLENGDAHGTAVAEVIYDVAPGASLYLVAVRTATQAGNAALCLASAGVTVINHSVVWPFDGKGDGTGLANDVVAAAVGRGATWINSAGNQAQGHWSGVWSDPDGDDHLDFIAGDAALGLGKLQNDQWTQTVAAGETIEVDLRWDDAWGAACNDYDLVLRRSGVVVAASRDRQGCTPGQQPFEHVSYVAAAGGSYDVQVVRHRANGQARLDIQSFNHVPEYRTAAGSVLAPADSASPGLIAVGAVNWATPGQALPSSSQGPTADGRLKPDLAAPAGVSTATYPGGFPGTSAAAAYVAGAAALVKEYYPAIQPSGIKNYVAGRSTDVGDVGGDSAFGSGRLCLGINPALLGRNPDATCKTTAKLAGGLVDIGNGGNHGDPTWSLAFWAQFEPTAGQGVLIGSSGAGGPRLKLVMQGAGELDLIPGTLHTWHSTQPVVLKDDRWHWYVVTFDSCTASFFRDGQSVASNYDCQFLPPDYFQPVQATTQLFGLGGNPGPELPARGKLAEFAIFKSYTQPGGTVQSPVLSPTEIGAWNGGELNESHPLWPRVLRYFKLNDTPIQDAARAVESSPAQTHGTYRGDVAMAQVGQTEGVPPIDQVPNGSDANRPLINAASSRGGVHTRTGNFSHSEVDVTIAGLGPVPTFIRTHNSNDDRANGPFGASGWTHNYNIRIAQVDGQEHLILIGPYGRRDLYTWNGTGYTPPPGVTAALTGTTTAGFTVTHKDQTVWRFHSNGKLTSVADRYGNTSRLSYDSSGRLAHVSDPTRDSPEIVAGLTFGYDDKGRLRWIKDSLQREVRFDYDTRDRLNKVVNRLNQITIYTYNGDSHRLETITNHRNVVVLTNTYENGRVKTQRDATNAETAYSYAISSGQKETTIDYPTPAASQQRYREVYTYDGTNWLVRRESRPLGDTSALTELFSYVNDNLESAVAPNGSVTSFCYDERRNVTRQIEPAVDGSRAVTLFAYDDKNNLTRVVAPKGAPAGSESCGTAVNVAQLNTNYATDYTYEGGTKLTKVTQRYTEPESLGVFEASTEYQYTDNDRHSRGLPTGIRSPRLNWTSLEYDNGLVTSVIDPLRHETSATYDQVGRRTSVTGPDPAKQFQASYEYDAEDRPRTVTVGQSSTGPLVTRIGYNDTLNMRTVTAPNDAFTTYTYDDRNLLKEIDEPILGADRVTTTHEYDPLGSLRRVTRSSSTDGQRVVEYAADGFGRVRQETQDPAGAALVTIYTYTDALNRLEKSTDGTAQAYQYDERNRLTRITYGGQVATPPVEFKYDAHGNRIQMSDPSDLSAPTTQYTYDELDRLLNVTSSVGNRTLKSRYDLDGNRVKLIYPDNTIVLSTYDAAGQLAQINEGSRQTSYTYSPDRLLQQITHVNGTTTSFDYDEAHRLTDVLNKRGLEEVISQHHYTLDKLGNRTQVREVLPELDPLRSPGHPARALQIDYTYDQLSRIKRALTSGSQSRESSYEYDAFGNRKSHTLAGQTPTTYTYDGADRLTGGTTGGQPTTYSVDRRGNLTQRGTDTFTYDVANRLKSATVNGTQSTYTYDGDGKRVSSTTGVTTTTYLYDVAGGLPVLLDDGTRKYVWGQGLAYALEGPNKNLEVYHSDGLGSVRAITNGSGNVVQTYQTDEFGVPIVDQAAPGRESQPFQYTGEQRDPTGLVYLRARMYDPKLARFLQQDPLAQSGPGSQGWNRYAYVGNNPANLTDPSGHIGGWVIGGIVGATLGAAIYAGAYATGYISFDDLSIEGYATAVVGGGVAGAVAGGAISAGPAIAATGAPALIPVINAAGPLIQRLGPTAQRVAAYPQTMQLQRQLARVLKDPTATAFTPRQIRALVGHPNLHNAFRGDRIDSAVKRVVATLDSPGLEITRRGVFGPDFHNPSLGIWWDVTTRSAWNAHTAKYGAQFGTDVGGLFWK
ncbi:MAG: carboxypeptidase regulatory-like domain-containing protein [Chloroflexi bacterium]|nr:carboxypeptidase regulatory-like domain-containing protein [Chloroflexota bacterium]